MRLEGGVRVEVSELGEWEEALKCGLVQGICMG